MVEGEGFEPSKVEPSDLQSDPFGRSGTPPENKAAILPKVNTKVNRYSEIDIYASKIFQILFFDKGEFEVTLFLLEVSLLPLTILNEETRLSL